MTNATRHQLSLSDIARLAGVKRPVVSMWRRRPLAGHAFPASLGRVGREERFDAAQVADYLAATSRGNNVEATDDLLAHAQLAQVTDLDEVVAVHGATALLCLAALSGESLGDLSSAELRLLARRADPHDTFLAREIDALGIDLETMASHADDLASAAYSSPAAFERVLWRHAAVAYPGHASTTLVPAAQSLVARVATALAADAGAESPLFVDVADSGVDLLLAVANAYAGELAPSVASLALDSPTARLARRRLRVHDLHRVDVRRDAAGDFWVDRGATDLAVHVMQLPPDGAPAMSDLEVLDAVGNLVVQLDDDSRVVVLGPASALTDRPRNAELDMARDPVLRSGRLRAVVRLPKGLVVRSPRQPLALWAFGPAHPSVAVRDRWTAVADVSDRPLGDSVIDGLVTDIVAAMTPDELSAKGGRVPSVAGGDDEQVLGHQFRFARRVATTQLTLGRTSLVDSATRTWAGDVHSASAAELAANVEHLLAQVGLSALANVRVEAAEGQGSAAAPTRAVAVTQAVSDGVLRVIPGNRLHSEHISTGSGGLRVFGPSEVLGTSEAGIRRISLLTFADAYPAGRLTEPGDVVVCASPRVGAMIDVEGGSVVQAPARVFRITAAGKDRLLSVVVAHDVNSPAAQRIDDWRRWSLRLLSPDSTAALSQITATVGRERQVLIERLAMLDRLTATVTDGAASGSLAITTTISSNETTTPATRGH